MAGNAANTSLWTGADVYVAAASTTGPVDVATAWPVDWKAAGLLDGEEGFTHGREEETSEHYAWGGVLYKRTKSKHKRTVKFVALEDNDVTFDLVNPGSTRTTDATTGVRTGKIKVPTTKSFAIGMEIREGAKIKRRWAKVAEVQEIGEIKESETEPTVYEITVVIFPETDGTIWTEIDDTTP
jgi:creatinine amidohydrolase/Fe(II)-dependent formamide hydrolase-like protein